MEQVVILDTDASTRSIIEAVMTIEMITKNGMLTNSKSCPKNIFKKPAN